MRAVIVAKTVMGQNLCVGAVEEATGKLLRLIPAATPEYHSWRQFEANVGSIVEVSGQLATQIEAPHNEDFLVSDWSFVGKRKTRLANWIRDNCVVWSGPRSSLFDGRLRFVGTGKGVINRSDPMPNHSVGFWSVAQTLRRVTVNGRLRFQLSGPRPLDMPYVGLDSDSAPELLQPGTLVRVSLSRWLPPRDAAFEDACWLQLSGHYEG